MANVSPSQMSVPPEPGALQNVSADGVGEDVERLIRSTLVATQGGTEARPSLEAAVDAVRALMIRSQDTLRQSEERFRLFFDLAPEYCYMISPEGLILDANQSALKVLGYTRDELIGRPLVTTIYSLRSQERARALFALWKDQGFLSGEEMTIVTKAGMERTVLLSASMVRDGQGRILHSTSMQTDITDRRCVEDDLRREIEARRHIEARLQESETKYRTIADFTADWETWVIPGGRFAYVSPSCEAITGHSADEFYRDPGLYINIVLPEDRPAVERHWAAKSVIHRESCQMDYRIRTRQGETRWISHTCRPVFDGSDCYLGCRGSNRDVTDRRRAEDDLKQEIEARKQTEERLRQLACRHETILNEVPDIIMEVDTRKVYTWANPAGYAFFGDGVIGEEAAHYFEGEQDTYRNVEPLFHGDASMFYVESWQRRRDGQRRLLAWWCQAIRDRSGQVGGALSTARDITDQRRLEQSLRESEARLRQATEAGNVGLWDWDLGTNRLYYSPEWKHQIGYEDHEISNDFSEWQSRVHPDDLGASLQTIRSFLDNPRPGFELEFRFRHKDGSYLWLLVRGSFIYDAQGKACRLVGSHVDITDLKRAEAALRDSEGRHRSLVENLPDVVARFDRECRYRFVSPAVKRYGFPPVEAFLGKTHGEMGFPEEDCLLWDGLIRRVIESCEPIEAEFEVRGMLFNWRLIPELDESGQCASVLSLARDITEHRRMQRDYRMLFEQMLDGFAVHEIILDGAGRPVDYRFLSVNPAFEQMTGLKVGDIIGKTVKEVLPSTEPSWIETYGKVALAGESVRFEQYHQGLKKHFEVLAFRPSPMQFACVIRDATQRKEAEARMADQIEELRRWHAVTLGRETRIMDLKQEVNALLMRAGQAPRYSIVTEPGGPLPGSSARGEV